MPPQLSARTKDQIGVLFSAEERPRVESILTDWRDLLVAAGFGHDPLAHERWDPAGEG